MNISDSTFNNIRSKGSGGAFYCLLNNKIEIINVTSILTESKNVGGFIYLYESNFAVINNSNILKSTSKHFGNILLSVKLFIY